PFPEPARLAIDHCAHPAQNQPFTDSKVAVDGFSQQQARAAHSGGRSQSVHPQHAAAFAA
ncbi:hypothetical protein, partial [Chromobacterium subtsugae]|uniref:hypothetical protein n=1 Tax=Chromobacterium subtsugae TaxID=251747 RepID=UPI001F1AC95E